MMTLRELLLRVRERFSDADTGCNGPWRVPQTPVRTRAHWLNLHAWAYRETGQPACRHTVQQLADYLVSPEACPHGYAFHCLQGHPSPGNGLIGQAWVMEALITASEVLKEPEYLQIASRLFWQHAFSDEYALWHRLNLDGTVGAVHPTLNQQVWFAAMGARLGDPNACQRVRLFLDRIESHLHLLRGGLLGMHIRPLPTNARRQRLAGLMGWLRQGWRRARLALQRKNAPTFGYHTLSVGYHAFTLYGFALLKEAFPDHPLWRSPRLTQAIEWCRSAAHKRALRRNPFAMGYNPAGFEVPYVLSVFLSNDSQIIGESRWWLQEQVRRHFNPDTGRFDRGTPDAATLTSRAYEATRLPPVMLDMEV